MEGLIMKYFVLKPAGNTPQSVASRQAMLLYATHIKKVDPLFAEDIYRWVQHEQIVSNCMDENCAY